MSIGLGHINNDKGGMCYAACAEAFFYWNASMYHCRKGCDFAMGRMQDPIDRLEAENMCKMYTSKTIQMKEDENLDDFDIKITLGTGSFGRVKLAKKKKTGEVCALKILKKHDIIKLKQVDHVISENTILIDIDHPFLVTSTL